MPLYKLLYSGPLCRVAPLPSERRPITIIMAYHRRRVALFKYALPHVAPLSSERRPITIIRAHHRHRITLYALPHHLDARNHILWVGLNLRGALRYVKEFALPEDEDKDETVLRGRVRPHAVVQGSNGLCRKINDGTLESEQCS